MKQNKDNRKWLKPAFLATFSVCYIVVAVVAVAVAVAVAVVVNAAYVLLSVNFTTLFEKKSLPSKASVADAIMIFTCSPDDTEAAVGDLLEKLTTVSERHSKIISNIWFAWELSLMVIAKLRKRLVKATLGPLLDKFFKPKL